MASESQVHRDGKRLLHLAGGAGALAPWLPLALIICHHPIPPSTTVQDFTVARYRARQRWWAIGSVRSTAVRVRVGMSGSMVVLIQCTCTYSIGSVSVLDAGGCKAASQPCSRIMISSAAWLSVTLHDTYSFWVATFDPLIVHVHLFALMHCCIA